MMTRTLPPASLLALSLSLAFLAGADGACDFLSSGDEDEDEGDEGEGEEGEGEGGEGEGEEGEGEEGEGEGEGEGCPGGVPVDPNTGECPTIEGEVYAGTAESGVVCGSTTCALSVPCCVSLNGFSVVATCGTGATCPGALATVPCDGPEDCTGGQDCCINDQYSSSCVAPGTCGATGTASVVCVDIEDCNPATELCCGVAEGSFALPVDLGVCAPAEQQCQAQ